MKAFIFNSGSGTRMGKLTRDKPKALLELSNGETILGRQIRLLKKSGIKDIIVSTGPFEDQIISLANKFNGITFTFVNNSKYSETNSIFSLFLAEDKINDDIIMLHGDLVFDSLILEVIINNKNDDLCVISSVAKKPEKDFKGRIVNNYLKEISVNIFDANCYALQPIYKFSLKTIKNWFIEIHKFIENDVVKVYAENALNQILEHNKVSFIDYKDHYVEEIDNVEDLIRVSNEFRNYDYKNQRILISNDYIYEIQSYIIKNSLKKPLIVHGKHLLMNSNFIEFISAQNFITYTEYSPNPKYEEVLKGLKIFKENNCDSIITIGGGSCIDLAKAIKLYSIFNDDYISQNLQFVYMPFLAIPTTAGSGTESTRFSVIYYKGEKQSLANDSILPDTVILNEEFLLELPDYHKKSSLLDALSQAIESFWSINSNDDSKRFSSQAIRLILDNIKEYIAGNISSYKEILIASNLAGKAINITQTTAPHAMSYKITTTKGISHGHAVSIMLPPVLEYMSNNFHLTQDKRGVRYVESMFEKLCEIFETKSIQDLLKKISNIIVSFDLKKTSVDLNDIINFSKSINPIRLKNSPILIDETAAKRIYKKAFNL